MANNFLPEHEVNIAVAASDRAAGSADVNGSALDMQGYEGVVAVVEMGTIAATAVTSLKWQQREMATATWADLAGTRFTIAADDDELFITELVRPVKRYVRLVVERATANAALRTALYIRYKPRNAPVSQGNSVNADAINVGPAEGTA